MPTFYKYRYVLGAILALIFPYIVFFVFSVVFGNNTIADKSFWLQIIFSIISILLSIISIYKVEARAVPILLLIINVVIIVFLMMIVTAW